MAVFGRLHARVMGDRIPSVGERVAAVDRDTLAARDVHTQFASNAPGPVVLTSDGGFVGGDSADSVNESDDVPGELGGEHLGSEPWVLATDGGVTDSTVNDTSAGDRITVPVAGGVLVFETHGVGRELIGFEGSRTGTASPTRWRLGAMTEGRVSTSPAETGVTFLTLLSELNLYEAVSELSSESRCGEYSL